ncbi:hypothetical protein ACE3MS_26250 [Paenibacillus dendritiformis]|uniref:hypothetical protein n=1 Tax=Paenibacillus dendritiformis TaxID=130049 RepID=UPI003664EAC8
MMLDHETFENEVFYGKKSYFIWHFMIGKGYQKKGYGKLAFEKMLMQATSTHGLEHSKYHFDNSQNRVHKIFTNANSFSPVISNPCSAKWPVC